jgi:hypothetical protein
MSLPCPIRALTRRSSRSPAITFRRPARPRNRTASGASSIQPPVSRDGGRPSPSTSVPGYVGIFAAATRSTNRSGRSWRRAARGGTYRPSGTRRTRTYRVRGRFSEARRIVMRTTCGRPMSPSRLEPIRYRSMLRWPGPTGLTRFTSSSRRVPRLLAATRSAASAGRTATRTPPVRASPARVHPCVRS